MTTQSFSLSTTWTCPAGVTSVQIECWGAGGGSGGAGDAGASGGGGGGAYSKKNAFTVVPGNNYTVTVGAVGNRGTASGTDGEDGGDTWFNSVGTVLAKGGKGTLFAADGDFTAGGDGGDSASGVGDVKFSGGAGGDGDLGNSGGAGGSSAGTASNGADGVLGVLGTPPSGAGSGGEASTGGTAGVGQVPGGGGGGAYDNHNGAYGAAGRLTLTYTATFTETTSGGVVVAGSAINLKKSIINASGGVLVNSTALLTGIATPVISGGVVVGGLSQVKRVSNLSGSGGVRIAGLSTGGVFIYGQGGARVAGTSTVAIGFVARGGLVAAGSGTQTFIDYVDGTGGVVVHGVGNVNKKSFFRTTAAGGADVSGESDCGITGRRYNPTGGITIDGTGSPVMKFNLDLTLTWNVNAKVVVDITLLWNTGRLINYWYRILARDKCSHDPCCQRYVLNVHARSLTELCDKLAKRGFSFSIDSVQRFTTPADTAEIRNLRDQGIDLTCNEFEDVPICDIPHCEEFCVTHDLVDQFGFDSFAQVNAFHEYEASDGIYMAGSAIATYERFLPEFHYEAEGGISIAGEAPTSSSGYNYESSGGIVMGGTVGLRASHWSFIGGQWPSTSRVRYAEESESLAEEPTDQIWSLTERVLDDNSLFSSTDISFGKTSQFLIVRGFQFDIPTNSTILHINVNVNRKANQLGVRDVDAYILVGDEIISVNKAKTDIDWPYIVESETTYDFTDSFELDDVNNYDIGFALRTTATSSVAATIASVQYVNVEVLYEDSDHQIVRMGGTVSLQSTGYSSVASGGIVVDGTMDVRVGYKYTSIGGILMGGTYGQGLAYEATGGIIMGGESNSRPSFQEIDGGGGAVLSGVADVKPYFEKGTGGVLFAGSASVKVVYKVVSSGGVVISGDSSLPFEEFAYTASGGITMGGESDRRSSHWSFVSDGNVSFVLGGADYYSSDFGLLVEESEFNMTVDSMVVSYGTAPDTDTAATLVQRLARCGCGDIPLMLNLEHGLARNNNFTKFLARNSLSISNRLKMHYNVPNDSWQSNLHFRGLSPDANTEETWDILFEVQCTQNMGAIFIGREIWKFGVEVFRKNTESGANSETRVLLGVIPDRICGANELKFKATFDTQLGVAEITPNATIYQTVLYDDIGLFKNPFWITSPDLVFTVSQVGLDTIQRRIDLTSQVLV